MLLQTDPDKETFSRKTGYDSATIAAAYSSPGSGHHQSAKVGTALEKPAALFCMFNRMMVL